MSGPIELSGPDLIEEGFVAADLAEGAIAVGHAGGAPVVLARRRGQVFAVGGACTHYGAPLGDGILVGDELRCPWHHACFDVRTGAAVSAPALNPLPCYSVVAEGERLFVRGEAPPRARVSSPSATHAPSRVVILGAGAAGNCTAETLRALGFAGDVTLVGADESVPYDRPNLSKDYLAGHAPEEWIPLRSREFYAERRIELLTGVRAVSIDTTARTVSLSNGRTLAFDALVLATGADPVRLPIPGADAPHVHTLRSLADSRRIITHATSGAKHAVVVGASFIGLEVAASLRARGLEVHVVAPESLPLERVLGAELGAFLRALHEEKGVRFALGDVPVAIAPGRVQLRSGGELPGDLVVMGVGVRPATALAEAAGIACDNGVLVSDRLETNVRGVYAAGDVARYPDPRSGRRVRIEHFVHAERMGQAVARNLLGGDTPFADVPFFWSAHYDVTIAYVGHAERWDRAEIRGSFEARDALVAYREGGAIRAVASIYRDHASLRAEDALRRSDVAALEALLS